MICVHEVFQHSTSFSMNPCTPVKNPDTSVMLYYTDNRALLAYDPSLQNQRQSLEQYQMTVPGYRAPDIFYQKKKSHDNTSETISRSKRDILPTKTVHTRKAVNNMLSIPQGYIFQQ